MSQIFVPQLKGPNYLWLSSIDICIVNPSSVSKDPLVHVTERATPQWSLALKLASCVYRIYPDILSTIGSDIYSVQYTLPTSSDTHGLMYIPAQTIHYSLQYTLYTHSTYNTLQARSTYTLYRALGNKKETSPNMPPLLVLVIRLKIKAAENRDFFDDDDDSVVKIMVGR